MFDLVRAKIIWYTWSMKHTSAKTEEYIRMSSGRLYNPNEKGIFARHIRALRLCEKYNRISVIRAAKRSRLLRKLIPSATDGCFVLGNFRCEYGDNIRLGANFFSNFDCKMLDVATITIGDNVMLGANVTLATPTHPLLAEERVIQQFPDGYHDLEYAKPIVIGDNVWIASGVTVCGGVTIGKNVVVGAGSVVTRDLPDDTLCFGVPCRVVRAITEADRLDVWSTYRSGMPPIPKGKRKDDRTPRG